MFSLLAADVTGPIPVCGSALQTSPGGPAGLAGKLEEQKPNLCAEPGLQAASGHSQLGQHRRQQQQN